MRLFKLLGIILILVMPFALFGQQTQAVQMDAAKALQMEKDKADKAKWLELEKQEAQLLQQPITDEVANQLDKINAQRAQLRGGKQPLRIEAKERRKAKEGKILRVSDRRKADNRLLKTNPATGQRYVKIKAPNPPLRRLEN